MIIFIWALLISCTSEHANEYEGHWVSLDPLSHQIAFTQDSLLLFNDLGSTDIYSYDIDALHEKIFLYNNEVDTSFHFSRTDSSFKFDDLVFSPHDYLDRIDFSIIPISYKLIDIEFDTITYSDRTCFNPIHVTKINGETVIRSDTKTLSIRDIPLALEIHDCLMPKSVKPSTMKIFIGDDVTNNELHEILQFIAGIGTLRVDLITKKYSSTVYSGLKYRIPILWEKVDSIRSEINPPPLPNYKSKRELIDSGIKEIKLCSIKDTSLLLMELSEQEEYIITINSNLNLIKHLELYNWLYVNGFVQSLKTHIDRKPFYTNCN